MKMKIREEDRTVLEMMLIILLYGILVWLAGMFFAKRKMFHTSGLWIGIMIAIFMLVYMYRILRAGLYANSKEAVSYVRKHSIIRYLSVVVAYALVIFIPLGNPISCFAGIMSLKLAAYMQPLMHKLLTKINTRREKEVEE